MNCTNCGAKVDDSARFCPVCGHKLKSDTSHAHPEAPQAQASPVEKSTYESIQNKENLIENQKKSEEKSKKESKIQRFISSFTSKKTQPKPKEEKIADEIFDNDNNYSHLNQKIEPDMANESQIPPSYYGYNPVEDRQRKDLRNPSLTSKNNPTDYVQNKVLHKQTESISEDKKPNLKQNQNYIPNQFSKETNLSSEMRIAQNLARAEGYNNQKNESLNEKVRYDDIPNEFVEARIARQINGGGPKISYSRAEDQDYRADDRTNAANRPVTGENQNLNSYEKANLANPIENETKEEPTKDEKEPFKFKPIYLLPLLIIALALAGVYFLKNRTAQEVEIDLSQYIDVTYSGDDGAASPSATLNTSKLLADYGNDIAYVNKDRKNDQYSSPANQLVDDLEKSTNFQFSKDSNLSNGEEITVVANVSDSAIADDYNVMFTNTIKSVIVDGLITQESVDPFEYMDVNFEGESPNITLSASFREDAPEYLKNIEIAPSKTSELASGEEVNISLNFDEEELFNSYGIRLNPIDKTFTAPGEDSQNNEENSEDENNDEASGDLADGFISTIDNLDEELLGTLKYNAGQLIRETFGGRSFTEINEINYLGAITGSDANADLKNRVMLIYEVKAKEDYEGRYTNDFTYYTFVEYQNVKDSKAEDGKFYTEGPITTDNEIFHKFFVEDDYTYYEIPYYGFAFLEEVITRANNALSGLNIEDSISVDISKYFEKSDGVAGEYQGNGTRVSLKSDGTLRYKLDQRVHTGKWSENGSDVSLTIQGVNVDTPINAKFENGALNVAEQGEMAGQTFNKMETY
ncbi:zinc ribbon domain-containing protein [uncultured Anaerococcus sp.]|uniref:zinc ribbon domain-containing protein n=1 Tax=uncultured Anaerococcus sp. TaxID=293428 RepID=UPI0025E42C73|nr:zinc ribbon domain-containing protein [uncultured Anaerococcus sp.]